MLKHSRRRAWICAALLVSASSLACDRPDPPLPLAELSDAAGVEDAAPPDDASPDAAPPDDAAPDVVEDVELDVSEEVSPDASEEVLPSCGAPGPGCPRRGEVCNQDGRCSDGLSCGLDGVCGGLGARCEAPSGCAGGALCSLSHCDGYARRCIQADRCLGPSRCEEGQCNARQLSVGHRTTCLLEPDGALGCWGSNFNDEANVPVGRYSAVSLGHSFACAITDAGRLRCWGDNFFGQRSPPNDVEALEVESGSTHACARLVDATVVCWGDSVDGQLDVPTGSYQSLSAGGRQACALKPDRTLVYWGDPSYREGLPDQALIAISMGGLHGCGLTEASREAVCWGLMDARVNDRPREAGLLAIDAGPEISCAIRANGSLVCWGVSSQFEVFAPPSGDFSQVAVGNYHACALEVDGPLTCWGDVEVIE